jgi:hypothetical protein
MARHAAGCQAAAVRATRWEILGAWLRIWTPPRDVEIPPIPRRTAALIALALAAATVVAALTITPAVDRAKQRSAASEARRLAASNRAQRAALRRDQRVQTARAPTVARLYAAGRHAAARAVLVRAAQASVAGDARARVAAGEFEVPVREVRCRPRRGGVAPRVRLSCFAVTSQTARVAVGQPFDVAGSLRTGRYAWCHLNPPPAEGATGTGVRVSLSAACTG